MILLISAATLLIIFGIAWFISAKISNASIVDAIWALSLPVPVIIYCTLQTGNPTRKILLVTMALIWSLRLGSHLLKRICKHHPAEDPRYAKLRDTWKVKAQQKFFILFLFNALLVFLLSLPFYFSSSHTPNIQVLEIIGLIIYAIGVIGETIADRQLTHFIHHHDRSEVCQIGLWHYSRHPNYFFEAVTWFGIYLFCAAAPHGIYTIHAPLLITYLLLKVTGIPLAEATMLRSKGDAYRAYQESTPSFLPRLKK